jgi:cytochrome c peroxidase
MDLKDDYFATEGRVALNSDKGRMNFTKNPKDIHRFKVPTLRNIEYTWPYLHDGTVTSLDESVRIMGDYLSGLSVPEKDRKLIVAFLRSLTGELHGKPLEGKVAPN